MALGAPITFASFEFDNPNFFPATVSLNFRGDAPPLYIGGSHGNVFPTTHHQHFIERYLCPFLGYQFLHAQIAPHLNAVLFTARFYYSIHDQ